MSGEAAVARPLGRGLRSWAQDAHTYGLSALEEVLAIIAAS